MFDMFVEEYEKVRKRAQKQYKKDVAAGNLPYPLVLDEIINPEEIYGEEELGIVEIPIPLIRGTKVLGRQNAFSSNFLPLLGENTEFARKWMSLYSSQIEEGIREPILAYEYLGEFYVQEGNKRVSVLSSLDMPGIQGNVTRIVPKYAEKKEIKIYYEYMEFYRRTKMNSLLFSETGGYEKVLTALEKDWDSSWSEEEIEKFKYMYYHFSMTYQAINGMQKAHTLGDAFLRYLEIFPYEKLKKQSSVEIGENLKKIKKEVTPQALTSEILRVTEPKEEKASILDMILAPAKKSIKAAFIYDKKVEDSGWIYGHELGRLHVAEVFKDKMKTTTYQEVENGAKTEEIIEQAVSDGNTVIFTTTPMQMQAAMQAALKFPDVFMFNCSPNFPYKSVRTYYARTYEIKFLLGILAGSLAPNDEIGYEADYPIYGSVANINAFAMGVAMVRPNAKVLLNWGCVKEEYQKKFPEKVKIISSKETLAPKEENQSFGLYHQEEGKITYLATSVLDWGKFYEKMLQFILDGTWKKKIATQNKTFNYWWGLSGTVMDIVYSGKIPLGTKKLVEKLKKLIAQGEFHPFEGVFYDQEGKRHGREDEIMTIEEIIKMNWLCDNVIGQIPKKEELTKEALALVKIQGIQEKNT